MEIAMLGMPKILKSFIDGFIGEETEWIEISIPLIMDRLFSDERSDGIADAVKDPNVVEFLNGVSDTGAKWTLDQCLIIFTGRTYHGMEIRIDADEVIHYRLAGRDEVELKFRDGQRIRIGKS